MAQKAWQKADMHRAAKCTLQSFFYKHASSKQHSNATQGIKGEQAFVIKYAGYAFHEVSSQALIIYVGIFMAGFLFVSTGLAYNAF